MKSKIIFKPTKLIKNSINSIINTLMTLQTDTHTAVAAATTVVLIVIRYLFYILE